MKNFVRTMSRLFVVGSVLAAQGFSVFAETAVGRVPQPTTQPGQQVFEGGLLFPDAVRSLSPWGITLWILFFAALAGALGYLCLNILRRHKAESARQSEFMDKPKLIIRQAPTKKRHRRDL